MNNRVNIHCNIYIFYRIVEKEIFVIPYNQNPTMVRPGFYLGRTYETIRAWPDSKNTPAGYSRMAGDWKRIVRNNAEPFVQMTGGLSLS